MVTIESMNKLDIMVQLSYYNTGKNRVPLSTLKKMKKKELLALYYKLTRK